MSRKRVKQYLTLLMAIGVIAIVAGGTGTFASFNAEVSHTGNTYATGTLLLHSTGTIAGGTTTSTCASESNSSNSNTTSPTGCQTLFTTSIGAPASGTLHTALTSGATGVVSIVADLTGSSTIEPGDLVKVSESTNSQTFTVTATVTPGSNVTIPVVSSTINANYSTSATVAVQTYTQYAKVQLANAGTLDAKDIKFAVPSCTNAAVQTLTLGSATLATTSSTAGTLTWTTAIADGAPASGTVTIGSQTLTLTNQLNPASSAGTTSAVTGTSLTAVTTAASVTSTPFVSGSGTLCNSLDFTIVETDSSYNHNSTTAAYGCAYGTSTSSGGIGCTFSSSSGYALGTAPSSDTALTLASGQSGNTGTELDHSQSRYFVVGVQTNVAGLTNSDQNQKATFSLKWHIDQK